MKFNINKIVSFFCMLVLVFCFIMLTSGNSSSSNETTESANSYNFKRLVQDWNKAHLSKDVGIFSNLYDKSVLFYGTRKDKNSCIENKLSLFKKHPDFYQQVYGDIQIENLINTEIKCNFVKRVTVNQATTDYPSYLIFKKIDGSWKIVTEGDLVTDKNISKHKPIKNIPKDAVKGDFNGDGVLDYMWLIPPKIDNDGTDCVGSCICHIKFSDPCIPSIKVDDCIGGRPDNEGDLNKNGTDEIGLLPHWFTSCWRGYHVWTFLHGKWVNAVMPIYTHCNQWDEGIKPIEIDFNKEGYVIIRYSEFTGSNIVTKSKSVRIAK